ncbi:trp operon repressor [Vibrio sp.]|uniref:Trp operon repressor homolog n=1 Tax=Vibrio viridaestus TaxID=2487322 RepID=A0A3N9TFP5_9VIBR|nr:trp operon repressor [Vibrio viridaestus]MDC0612291.1 trp operon repressor [Vibrio sp.]RQW63078.1 trp operon repressor [Vibrio viridaestus]
MSPKPEFEDWQSFLDLVKKSVDSGNYEMLLTMMMTSDERDTLVSRVNIVCELLKGDLSQRQISQMLGVGVATITRGSNELKGINNEEKSVLTSLLLEKR